MQKTGLKEKISHVNCQYELLFEVPEDHSDMSRSVSEHRNALKSNVAGRGFRSIAGRVGSRGMSRELTGQAGSMKSAGLTRSSGSQSYQRSGR